MSEKRNAININVCLWNRNAPNHGQFQKWPRSQGQGFRTTCVSFPKTIISLPSVIWQRAPIRVVVVGGGGLVNCNLPKIWSIDKCFVTHFTVQILRHFYLHSNYKHCKVYCFDVKRFVQNLGVEHQVSYMGQPSLLIQKGTALGVGHPSIRWLLFLSVLCISSSH